jgi:nitrate reductase NapAB chaperone NapD
MTIAGVLVVCRPERLSELRGLLAEFSWAEVHHSDPAGRLVITIETATTQENMERLKAVQRLPPVLFAEMVEHYVEDEKGS